jgi:exopolyphosphatase/guanosine-5'-triphosphate,3'-diphosphate pyrophosphatase
MVKSHERAVVIDIGSNTIKLLVAVRAASGAGALEPVDEAHEEVRISRGSKDGPGGPVLDGTAVEAAAAAINRLLARARSAEPAPTTRELVATSAIREAANRTAVCATLEASCGLPVQVLSGAEEAQGIARGVLSDPNLRDLGNFVILDLGGGSLETIEVAEGSAVQALSLPLGAVRLMRRFVDDPSRTLPAATRKAIEAHIAEVRREQGPQFQEHPRAWVGTGGAFSVCRFIFANEDGEKPGHGAAFLPRQRLEHLLERLIALPESERARIPGLPPSRADILPVALVTILALTAPWEPAEENNTSGINKTGFRHSFHNLRYGRAANLLGL